MTVKTRVMLLIVGTGFVSSLFFSIVVFYELLEQPFALLDQILKEESRSITRMVISQQKTPDVKDLEPLYQTTDNYWIEIYERETHRIIFRSRMAESVTLPPVNPGSRVIAKAIIQRKKTEPGQDRSHEVSFRARTFSMKLDGRSFDVQIARQMGKLDEEIWELFWGIVAGLFLSTMILIAISRWITGKILQPVGWMKNLAQDISEKNLDKRIPVGEGQDEFSELAGTINRMLDRLQYSFSRQRELLFNTSHELKTPLSTMRLAVDEICGSGMNSTSSSTKANLSRLSNQTLRMERLVKDLLSLSSLETLTGIDSKPVQISELLSSLATEYQFLAAAHDIRMAIHLPERLVVNGDGEKLRRVFSNILDNAVKYNNEGGQIEMTGNQSEAGVTITIANTGSGVPETEISRVFDQFYRVDKSRSLQHGGSGLGLAIVRKIVELHTGQTTFESQEGGWTRVTVTLPMRHKTAST